MTFSVSGSLNFEIIRRKYGVINKLDFCSSSFVRFGPVKELMFVFDHKVLFHDFKILTSNSRLSPKTQREPLDNTL